MVGLSEGKVGCPGWLILNGIDSSVQRVPWMKWRQSRYKGQKGFLGQNVSCQGLSGEVSRLHRAMERQAELLLELVKLQQGNLIDVSEREP